MTKRASDRVILTPLFVVFVFAMNHYASCQNLLFLQANLKFSTELFSNISSSVHLNTIISPISVGISLTHLLVGASGKTYKNMLAGLKYPNNYSANLIRSNSLMFMKNISKIGGISLKTKLYVNNRVTIQKTYTTTITKYFLSQIETADFEDSKATVNTINGFIFDQTRGLIENMLEEDDIDHSASLIMVNVIYFKGVWVQQFDKRLTSNLDFYLSDDRLTRLSIPMMQTNGRFKVGLVAGLRNSSVLELPYANTSVVMTIVMPSRPSELAAVVEAARSYDFTQLSTELNFTNLIVFLPKFNASTKVFLNKFLNKMGMASLFSSSARLDRIASVDGLPISISLNSVLHQAIVCIDEEGTRAAAATLKHTRALREQFRAEWPFFYMLRTNITILFMGLFTGN